MRSAAAKNIISLFCCGAALMLAACGSTMHEDVVEPAAAEPAVSYEAECSAVRISELMVKNHTVRVPAGDGFTDWLELENTSGEAVNLGGWIVTDGDTYCELGSMEIPAHGYSVIYFDDSRLKLKPGSTVSLKAPDGTMADGILCPDSSADMACIIEQDGSLTFTSLASPGYENSKEGYEAYCSALKAEGPLVINEVMVSNSSYARLPSGDYCDWVELKNISDESINLDGYYLSDKNGSRTKFPLPGVQLEAGQCLLVYCDGKQDMQDGLIHAGFSLSASGDRLWLSDGEKVLDSVWLHDIPVNGSCGRLSGKGGFFYFTQPTPGTENTDGKRFIAEAPAVSVPSGCYDGVESLTIEFSAPGTIYYTLDGSLPAETSAVYTGPVEISATTIIRAMATEPGACDSRVVTCSYFVNEGHSLPVLSLVTDDEKGFWRAYNGVMKSAETSAVLSLYSEAGEEFSQACGVHLRGKTSLSLPKKSLGVYFRGRYGDGSLKDTDLFGTGIAEYSSLVLRAGQDMPIAVIRNELFQELCAEGSDVLYTQHSRYCVLYINGKYRGIYCLKENLNDQYYAACEGINEDSVRVCYGTTDIDKVLTKALENAWYKDMSVQENYEEFCSVVDIPSFIDWIIYEGYCANSDTLNNIRYFMSPEADGKYHFVFFDLDWAFHTQGLVFCNIISGAGHDDGRIRFAINGLARNSEFRAALLTRAAELLSTTLSNENVLATIDRLEAEVIDELPRDGNLYGSDTAGRIRQIERLRKFVTDLNMERYAAELLCSSLGVSRAERMEYFGF